MVNNMNALIDKIIRKIFRKKFLKNYNKYCNREIGRALLYYKTDPLVFKNVKNDFSHTNNWEIFEIVKILNELGFVVDIIDRTVDIQRLKLKDEYTVFIGAAAGDSGKYYAEICEMIPSAKKIFYALGLEPNLSNEYMNKRYEYFSQRHPDSTVQRRRIRANIDIEKSMKKTDAIFCVGNSFTQNSFKKFNKPMYRIQISSSPKLSSDTNQITKRSQNKFLYFGGNGNIVKGLDLVIEAFSKLPEFELHIGAPDWEKDFNTVYKEIIDESPNIHFHGFLDINSSLFEKITSECGYVILPSSSEGCATSITACMRRALVPIITKETGVDLGDFGYSIDDIRIEKLREQITEIANSDKNEFLRRSQETYDESFMYTQASFSESFKKSLSQVINNEK